MSNNKIYLAYGSNLDITQMAQRCPEADILGKTELQGFDLKFRGVDGYAVATVEPGVGSVPALLWTISPSDEARLDHYEGAPYLYRKETMTVELDGKPIEAMVYIMNDGRDLGAPSQQYLNGIRNGYLDAGFDAAVLDAAVAYSSNERTRISDALRDKLSDNYEEYERGWLAMSPSELIGEAEELVCIKKAYNDLTAIYIESERMERLLRYENPLSIVADGYERYDSIELEDLDDALREMLGKEMRMREYTLDPEYAEPTELPEMEM
jgi:AIG2-like family.